MSSLMNKRIGGIVAFAMVLGALTSCSGGKGSGDAEESAVSREECETKRTTPNWDEELMVFMKNFVSDKEFQLKHTKFPLGDLGDLAADGDGKPIDKEHWMLVSGEMFVVANKEYEGEERWVAEWTRLGDKKMEYMNEDKWVGRSTYTFEKIDGEWMLTGYEYRGDMDQSIEMTDVADFAAETSKDFGVKGWKEYKWDGTAGEYPQATDKKLTEKDLEGISKKEARMMRNEIFARHGHVFESKDLKDYFEGQPWYFPLRKVEPKELTETERENIKLIKKYE